ncbi:MAG TPA: CoA pyrophosphatase [Burkholderiaceae bacterium]|nr:CoA pyrophosphatase [Burkholderiaceae bacterium]
MSLFDPRRVPVVRQDGHLPAVPTSVLSPGALRARFADPPAWQPELRQERSFGTRAPAEAAVLMAIVQRPEPTLLLTQRGRHLNTHSGQIALPGGKVDGSDASHVAAALRETHEEVGIAPDSVDVLGCLPVYITGTAFTVTPVVGLLRPDVQWVPNTAEVDDVFEVPLAFLMNPAHHRLHRVVFEGVEREWYSMPYPDRHTERFIWGATAGMLRNLYAFLQA